MIDDFISAFSYTSLDKGFFISEYDGNKLIWLNGLPINYIDGLFLFLCSTTGTFVTHDKELEIERNNSYILDLLVKHTKCNIDQIQKDGFCNCYLNNISKFFKKNLSDKDDSEKLKFVFDFYADLDDNL